MSYVVIKKFIDLQDFNHTYNVGEEYPRQGVKPSPQRIDELSTDKNKRKIPLIKKVEKPQITTGEKGAEPQETFVETKEEMKQEETNEKKGYTKTEINRMNKEELIALATDNGIENAEEQSGNELKRQLIEMLVD